MNDFNEAGVKAEFADALAAAGLQLKALPIMDGQWHRAAVEGDKRHKRSGRYRGYLTGIRPAGFIQNFKDETRTRRWKSGATAPAMSPADDAAMQHAAAEAKARRTAERTAAQAEVAARAEVQWSAASSASAAHPYLRRKGVQPYGLRVGTNGALLVPMRDFDGKLWGLQRIAPNRTKRFAERSRVAGLHLVLGELATGGVLLIAEGYATAATLHAATGHATAVAFSKGNFTAIARSYGERFPGLRVAFCGDNDHHLPRHDPPLPNVGREAARAAARDVGGVAILPDFEDRQKDTDWNDYAALHGFDAVRIAIEAALPPPPPPAPKPHYPAPTNTRPEGLAALQRATTSFLDDAASTIAIRREWQALRTDTDDMHPIGSPGRRAALRAASRHMTAAHGKAWRAPGRRLLLPAAAGSGKTALVTQQITGRCRTLGNIFFATDKLANAEAVAAAIPGAGVVRGRSAIDPKDAEGRTMCWRPKAAEAVARAGLPVSKTLCRDDAGKACPCFSSCGYQKQVMRLRSGDVSVFAGSHEYLTLRAPMPVPDLVVIDENCVSSLVGHLEFGFDRLLETSMPDWQIAGLHAAMTFRTIMAKVRDALRDPAGILAGLRAHGITEAGHLKPAIAYLRAVEDRHITSAIAPDMEDAAVVELLEQHKRSEISAILKVLTALQAEIILPRAHAHTVVFYADKVVTVDGRQERQDRIGVHYRKRLAFDADVPVLVLDASGDVEIYRRLLAGRLEIAPDVRCERSAEIIQVRDVTLARSSLIGTDRKGNPLSATSVAKAARLRSELAAVVNALAVKHGSVMLATNMPVETALIPELNDAVATGHFGALRGRNNFQHCPAGLLAGREQPPVWAVENIARALWANDPEPLILPGVYQKATRGIRMRDGTAMPVEADVHPDTRVQRVLELHRERESEQGVDRLRLIHNAEPKRVYIACNLPLDVTVDRTVTWKQMVYEITGRIDNGKQGPGRRTYTDRFAEAWRRSGGVLPLSRTELVHLSRDKTSVFSGLWMSERSLRDDMGNDQNIWRTRLIEVLLAESASNSIVTIIYRRAGPGRPSRALVALPDDAGRAALEALVGPVVSYEVEHVTDPPVAADPPVQQAAAPISAPAPPPSRSPPMAASATTPLFLQVQRRALQHLGDRLEAKRPQSEAPPPWVTSWPQQHNYEGARR